MTTLDVLVNNAQQEDWQGIVMILKLLAATLLPSTEKQALTPEFPWLISADIFENYLASYDKMHFAT